MSKGLRLSEKWFTRGLWLIALLFAGFLIGLGSLVVQDLPRVERPPDAEQFTDQAKLRSLRAQMQAEDAQMQDNRDAMDRATIALQHGRQETETERAAFENWIASRTATQQSSQNEEVLARTRNLDALKARDQSLQAQVNGLEDKATSLKQTRSAQETQVQQLLQAGEAGYRRAQLRVELRVFLLRLALILPLLLIAIWLFLKRRKGPRWPFVWGFIFFALFTFFVELVPYLPSYGGYVRYIVGIVLTVLAGNYAIAALRRYLDAQKLAEQKPEDERRRDLGRDLGYDVAQMRLAKRVCPGCERPIDPADPSGNFCMHCGLLVFEECPRCSTRQTAFSHFCRACGLVKHSDPAAPPLPGPVASV